MPMYSYWCNACYLDKERIVKVDDRDGQTCESCRSPLHRKIDKPGAVWAPTSTSGGLKV